MVKRTEIDVRRENETADEDHESCPAVLLELGLEITRIRMWSVLGWTGVP